MNRMIIEYSNSRWKSTSNNWGIYFGKIIKIYEKTKDFNLREGDMVCFVGDPGYQLKFKQLYSISGEYKDSDYGKQLSLLSVSEYFKLENKLDKDSFLKTILTEKQLRDINEKFGDAFELLEKGDRASLLSVSGIGETVVDRLFEKFNKTRDNAHVYAHFSRLGFTNDFIRKMIYACKNGDLLLQQFKQNPYSLIDEVKGLGFLKIDDIVMENNLLDGDSIERIHAASCYFLAEKLNGSTYIGMTKFKEAIKDFLRNSISDNTLDKIIEEMYEKGFVFIDGEKKVIGLMKYYLLEKEIANELKRIMEAEPVIKIDQGALTKENIENKIKELEEEQGWSYTDEQIKAIKMCFIKKINVVYALAGTGKTTIVNAVLRILKGSAIIHQVALAGKAAQRMQEVTKCPAATIHRTLGFIPELGFQFNKHNQLNSNLIIIDESSMLSLDLFYDLLVAIPDGCKIIMLGDIGQLESVGIGNLLKDLIECNKIPKIQLTKIHRQAQKSAIITNSINIRNAQQIINRDFLGYELRGELKDLEIDILPHGNNLSIKIIEYFKRLYFEQGNDILDIQVVLPKKDLVLEINNTIQSLVNKSTIEVNFTKDFKIKVGDKVINRKNNYNSCDDKGVKTPVFNGNIGIVTGIDIENKKMNIDFENIGSIIFNFEDCNALQLGYAITCHSAQGSQWKNVIVGINQSMYFFLSREWLYTAMTRASQHCILIAQNQALLTATTISNINKKNTFLRKII